MLCQTVREKYAEGSSLEAERPILDLERLFPAKSISNDKYCT